MRSDFAVTYVANTGFLIESDDKKILVDALFGGFDSDWCYVPPDSAIDLMVKARPPFDDVDVIAASHMHKDHFNADYAIDHLLHNTKGILVCPAQVAETLSTSIHYSELRDRIRVVSLPLDSVVTITVSGVAVTAIRTAHLPTYEEDVSTGKSVDRHRDVEHLEFIFSLAGKAIYHSGDTYMNDVRKYESYGFGSETIDLAFVGWWDAREMLTFEQLLIRDVIRPERVILMHLLPDREPRGHPEREQSVAPEVYLPQYSMQTWTFPIKTEQGTE
ncbi:MAG: MBL fold metallo-hydrolase [Candidatus Zixiibacteriota bacterium]|nr:MAG: MBL fold metallo-hydrolase [candidate division Zixibacteria bacterium]